MPISHVLKLSMDQNVKRDREIVRSEIDLCLHRIQQFHVDLLRIWGGVSLREAAKRIKKEAQDR